MERKLVACRTPPAGMELMTFSRIAKQSGGVTAALARVHDQAERKQPMMSAKTK